MLTVVDPRTMQVTHSHQGFDTQNNMAEVDSLAGVKVSRCSGMTVVGGEGLTLLAPKPALDHPSLLADDSTIIVALALALARDRALAR